MATTVRMIMILLYGAGGEPGRGATPMQQISSLLLSDFPSQGVLRTNIANRTYQPRTFSVNSAVYIVIL